jgi:hypothetical protein
VIVSETYAVISYYVLVHCNDHLQAHCFGSYPANPRLLSAFALDQDRRFLERYHLTQIEFDTMTSSAVEEDNLVIPVRNHHRLEDRCANLLFYFSLSTSVSSYQAVIVRR